MKGRLFGVGVGPGDPELMTYKAVRIIKECQVLAVPARGRKHAVSYRIAAEMIENMEEKEFLDLDTPMTKDRQILDRNYENAAGRIIEELEKGKDVAYLTLGDPTIYSTYMYIHRIVKAKGYETTIISGIPSFCAAAAKMTLGMLIGASHQSERLTNFHFQTHTWQQHRILFMKHIVHLCAIHPLRLLFFPRHSETSLEHRLQIIGLEES